MRRIAVITAAVALLAWNGSGASAAKKSASTPVAVAILAACHPSDDVTDRFATFVGQMQSVKGTARMTMHFTLLEKLEPPTFDPVAISELRPRRRSKKGSTTFLYTQRVTALRDGRRIAAFFYHGELSGRVSFDSTLTKVADGTLVKVCSWYDNEWGFSNRMLDVAVVLAQAK